MNLLYKQMAVGAGWMTMFTLLNRFLGLISTVVLARLLIPEDFGIIAMSMSMIAAIDLLTGLSLHVVLIQRETITDEHYDTAWTLNFLLSTVSGALVFFLAPSTADFFNEPRLVAVIQLLSISVFAKGLENIRIVEFQRNLEFNKDFLIRFIPRLAGFLITIPIALKFKSYWALVAGMIGISVVQLVISYMVLPYIAKFRLSRARELIGFSSWLLVTNVLAYGFVRGRDIIVGRTLGSSGLGSYTLANELATLPSSQLIAPINRAVYPGYAKLSSSLADLRKGFSDVTGVIALIGFPASVGVAAVAEPLVAIVLGEKWMHIVELMKMLAINGAIGVGLTNIGPVFNSLAKPKYMAYLQIISIATLLPFSYWFATNYGLMSVGYATLLSSMVSVPISFWLTCRLIEMPIWSLMRVLWRPAVSAVLMYFAVTYTISVVYPSDWFRLAVGVSVGGAAYFFAVFACWLLARQPDGPESFVVNKVLVKLGRRSA